MTCRPFPKTLHHEVPCWVEDGALFHLRIRLDARKPQRPLTDPTLASVLLDSVKFYDDRKRWFITIFLLMPDHLHALVSFPRDQTMARTVGDWKHFHAKKNHISWQENFFDHRLRDDERGQQFSEKINYIRNNPVASRLCARVDEWPWWIGRSAHDLDLQPGTGVLRSGNL